MGFSIQHPPLMTSKYCIVLLKTCIFDSCVCHRKCIAPTWTTCVVQRGLPPGLCRSKALRGPQISSVTWDISHFIFGGFWIVNSSFRIWSNNLICTLTHKNKQQGLTSMFPLTEKVPPAAIQLQAHLCRWLARYRPRQTQWTNHKWSETISLLFLVLFMWASFRFHIYVGFDLLNSQ